MAGNFLVLVLNPANQQCLHHEAEKMSLKKLHDSIAFPAYYFHLFLKNSHFL